MMAAAIKPLDTELRRQFYRAGEYPRAEVTKDVDRRYRWDLFNAAGLSRFAVDTLYRYCADPHIDSALKSIVPPLSQQGT